MRDHLQSAFNILHFDLCLPTLLTLPSIASPSSPKPLPSVERRWRELGDDALAISVICEAELLYGLQLKQSAKLNSLYEQLLEDRLQPLTVDAVP